MDRLWQFFEKNIIKFALLFVVLNPLLTWALQSLQTKQVILVNPYVLNDLNLTLIFSILALIYNKVSENFNARITGDESKIIMNRNESDYYEIWEEVRKSRKVVIEALGHSFNTLWFNFIKKFIYEVISNESHFDSVSITLISTKPEKNCYEDIEIFYNSFEPSIAKKITFKLVSVNSTTFFTGCCVNREALWLSIREPHKLKKTNEHVREWRRNFNKSSEKMLNWYTGIIDHFISDNRVVELIFKPEK